MTAMDIPLYQIDAFTSQAFRGNPAAICPLADWLPDELMQQLAAENNLSETAFCVPTGGSEYQLRWFTPTVEVELCGHATLATAWVLWNKLNVAAPKLSFQTLSGTLQARRVAGRVQLNFPARPSAACAIDAELEDALGSEILACRHGANRIAVLKSAAAVQNLRPDFQALEKLPYGVIATAADETGEVDFVSRYFAVPFGVTEDPVTGSAHCDLMPYWSGQLGNSELTARQVSKRGGELSCTLQGDRVLLVGDAVCVVTGQLHLPASQTL